MGEIVNDRFVDYPGNHNTARYLLQIGVVVLLPGTTSTNTMNGNEVARPWMHLHTIVHGHLVREYKIVCIQL